MSAITIKNLSKNYGQFQALQNLNVDIPKGKITGLLGPNGAGKSTLMRCLVGLIKLTQGEIQIMGEDIHESSHNFLNQIGCIIEKPDFYGYLSAQKNLELLASISKNSNAKKNIHTTLKLVGLIGRELDKVKTYSHGMKQRLGIAQCLIHNPQIIILDEPTTGLDPEGIIEFRNLIIKLRDEFGKTILLSSHILSEIELVADYIIIINKGKLIAQGNIAELLNEEDMIVYLETNDNLRCQALLESIFSISMTNHTSYLKLKINKLLIPTIVEKLVEHKFKVYNLEVKRGLEELYLNITNHGHETS